MTEQYNTQFFQYFIYTKLGISSSKLNNFLEILILTLDIFSLFFQELLDLFLTLFYFSARRFLAFDIFLLLL